MMTPTHRVERAAFTLVELLVVMGLMAIIMGLAVGRLTRVTDFAALDTAERVVRAALARTKSSAAEQTALAGVTFFPAKDDRPSRMNLTLTRDAGNWQFNEDKGGVVSGGRNNVARLFGAKLSEDGWVRRAAEFEGSARVVCDPGDGYEPTRGFELTAYVYPDPESKGGLIFSYGEALSLELDDEGTLVGQLSLDEGSVQLTLRTPKGVVAKGAWAKVELFYDGFEGIVRAHGVVEARSRAGKDSKGQQVGTGPFPLAALTSRDRLTFGGSGFDGLLDEISYRTVEDDEVVELENRVEFDLQSPLEVRFSSDGRLDGRFHEVEMSIPLRHEDRTSTISVDLSGVVR